MQFSGCRRYPFLQEKPLPHTDENSQYALTVQSHCPPYTFFSRLRRDNPSPFGAYLQYGSYQIVSASMERLLCLRHDQIETRPIKGTRRRGNTPAEDEKLRQELAQSQKDQSELLMIVDLERNDLHNQFGLGTFETIPVYQGRPVWLEAHERRLRHTLEHLGIDLPSLWHRRVSRIPRDADGCLIPPL